jgi:hypothetical protein
MRPLRVTSYADEGEALTAKKDGGPLSLRAPWRTRLLFAITTSILVVALKVTGLFGEGGVSWQWSYLRDGFIFASIYLMLGIILEAIGIWSDRHRG